MSFAAVNFDELETRYMAKCIRDVMAAVVGGAHTVEEIAKKVHEGEIVTRFVCDFLVSEKRLCLGRLGYHVR